MKFPIVLKKILNHFLLLCNICFGVLIAFFRAHNQTDFLSVDVSKNDRLWFLVDEQNTLWNVLLRRFETTFIICLRWELAYFFML